MPLAVAIFLRSTCQSKVLLIKRRDVPVYALPGGGVEENETPIEAGIREMKEETGLDVSFKRIIGHYYPINRLTKPTILIECEKICGEETISNETKEVRYFSLTELPYLLPPPYLDWITDGFNQNSPCFKPISSVTYKKFLLYLFQHPILILRFVLSRLNIPINSN
jgi:ADP-ribose pyrophosphatase YjhB (NUDIX family)